MRRFILAALLMFLPLAALGQIQGIVNGSTVGLGFTSGQCLTVNGTGTGAITGAGCGGLPSGAAGGDLTGTYPNPSLAATITGAHTFSGGLAVTPHTGNNVPVVINSSNTASCVTTGTAETQLASIAIPAMGANDSLYITTMWSNTNSVNNKTQRIRFSGSGGTSYMAFVVTITGITQQLTIIRNNNATNAQKGISTSTVPYLTTASAMITSAVDTSVVTNLYISATTASSGESVCLEGRSVVLVPGV